MTRVALYARYSSDNQREASIEDQLRLCREHAARERWTVVGTYADAAIPAQASSVDQTSSGFSPMVKAGNLRLF
ncbi:recombinase family protein [Mesorhizobium sp. M0768]|uniref:recombinase family protein n=1 Tax=Mesorhizobium sp. M0768 TaxID=2956996 RepID=UPI003339240C